MLADGVVEGRRIFANTLKYVLMATSSNFGNMFSAAGASLFLSFLPMLPVADPAQQPALRRRPARDPHRQRRSRDRGSPRGVGHRASCAGSWPCSARSARSSTSSTFFVMLTVLNASHAEFRSGWFVESLATQTLVVFLIRTRRVPFFRSRPSRRDDHHADRRCALVGAILPFTPLAAPARLHHAAGRFFLILVGMIVSLPGPRRGRQEPLLRPRATTDAGGAGDHT